MVDMCFFELDTHDNSHTEFCLGPRPLDDFGVIFEPHKILADDPDRCGFYFFPVRRNAFWRKQSS